jgi:hypothetical protein
MRRASIIATPARYVAPGLPRAAFPAISGASGKERQALDRVLAGMPATAIDRISRRTASG